MSKVNLNKDFLGNVDYLKELVKICNSKKNLDEYDENLVYEVAYAHEYLNQLILLDNNPSKELIDLADQFDIIMGFVGDKNLESSSSMYLDLLKLRNIDPNTSFEDKKESYTYSPVKYYMWKNKYRIVFVFAWSLFMISGIFTQLLNLLGVFSYVINITSTFLCIFINLQLMLDLMYITMPMVRDMLFLDIAQFVSDNAKLLVNNENVYFRIVKDYNRRNRNLSWLKVMQDKKCGSSDIDNAIQDVAKIVSNESGGREYWYGLAKIEFLHTKYVEALAYKVKSEIG